MRDTIIAKDLSVGFAGKQVLNRITFKIKKGEIWGLLGPSGAGKATLIKLLTGQLGQDEGYAGLLGKDTRKLSAPEHGKIGIMMDNFGLYDRLSVYDNLAFYADIYHISRNGIRGILESINLYEARKTAVSKLSKGMKNRLSLARALMNQPRILFLDEPTSGLDPATARDIYAVLTEQRKKDRISWN